MDTQSTASRPGFDAQRLDAWLRANVPGVDGEMTLGPIAGGQSNPTFFVSYPGRRMVLRKRPAGPLLPSAHAVDREHRIMNAIAYTGVPVPRMIAFYAGSDIVGTAFYVMERLDGRIFSDCSMPGAARADRCTMIFEMADTLARLHRVDWEALGLADFGREGNFFARRRVSSYLSPRSCSQRLSIDAFQMRIDDGVTFRIERDHEHWIPVAGVA